MELSFYEIGPHSTVKKKPKSKKNKDQQQEQQERRARRLKTMLKEGEKRTIRLRTRVTQRVVGIASHPKIIPRSLPAVPPDALTRVISPDLPPVQLKEAILPEDRSGQLLLVTSFNEKLYLKTGCKLLESFAEFYRDDAKVTMLVCHEGFKFVNHNPRVITYNLDSSEFLKSWSRRNAPNIPIDLGGTATKTSNPRLFANKFNLQMSRWFRKIASLEYAYRKFRTNYRGICWIDCDCMFRQHLSASLFFGTLGDKSVGYHQGLRRRMCQTGVETGLVIFKGNAGYQVLYDWINLFESGKFIGYSRWDDGFVFKELIDREYRKSDKKHRLLDFGRTSTVSCVMNESVFSKFVLHRKGIHYKDIIKEDLARIPGTRQLLE